MSGNWAIIPPPDIEKTNAVDDRPGLSVIVLNGAASIRCLPQLQDDPAVAVFAPCRE